MQWKNDIGEKRQTAQIDSDTYYFDKNESF